MSRLILLGLWLFFGCAPPSGALTAEFGAGGLEVQGSQALGAVRVEADDGTLVLHQPLPEGSERAFLTIHLEPGRYRVSADGAEVDLEVVPTPGLEVVVEAPVGQLRHGVHDGDRVVAPLIGEAEGRAALVLTARVPWTGRVLAPGVEADVELAAPGDRELVGLPLTDQPLRVEIRGSGEEVEFTVVPQRRTLEEARSALTVEALHLPTDSRGAVDRARPPDRVSLPSAWWRRLLRSSGLGYRPRDDQAPWAWQSLTLRNRDRVAMHVVVRAAVLDEAGLPAAAFRPRLRESVGNSVQVLLRIPPGTEATASLPLFVSGSELGAAGRFTRRVEVLALGATEPLHVVERPLWVSRGSRWASGWLVAALAASTLGWLWLGLGAPRWIRRARTGDLVTIATFASVTWVAGTVLQVAGLGVAAVLGPFAPLLTGVVDDALRACLLGTLIALVPRPGTAALATAVGFVMRGLTMGTFHPVDLLYLGSAVFWLESWLWISGCTRGLGWRDGPWAWARLCVGLGLSNMCATATALVVSVVFYRLYFANWYVALILALPGFLYVCAGCWLAVGFGRALRRVEG